MSGAIAVVVSWAAVWATPGFAIEALAFPGLVGGLAFSALGAEAGDE